MRELAPQVLAVLVRGQGDFARCEDALQEALVAAARQWPASGVPDNPKAWLITVASRRWTELWRNETARVRREQAAAALEPPPVDPDEDEETDDSLGLLLLCCHAALTVPSQVALTLRAMGGLTTAEIARALLVPEATIAQRISRAKQRIRAAGASFSLPPGAELSTRLGARPARALSDLHRGIDRRLAAPGCTASSSARRRSGSLASSTPSSRATRWVASADTALTVSVDFGIQDVGLARASERSPW